MKTDTYYKPVLGDDEHLLESTETPGRYRGLSRDHNNDNPGIPELIPYEIDDNEDSHSSDIANCTALVVAIAEVIDLTIKYGIPFYKEYVKPFAKERILPRIKKMYGKVDQDDSKLLEDYSDERDFEENSHTELMEEHEWRLIKARDEGIA